MKLEDQILVNRFGQGLIAIDQLTTGFRLLELMTKKKFLNELLFLIMQSKPEEGDIEPAIIKSDLKSTFIPCVLLKKGVANHNLKKIINLPEYELTKAFVLLLNLFKVAYERRFINEKDNPHKWWYWDLSDHEKLERVMVS
ncbi:hypothetical protein K2F45_07090 [Sphingobacterium siyangense]|uniref:DUF5958 family protein n=1 Tax=Sphingobacterium TaxID=28453 RepID=UPI0009588E51|nr:MULTISPECIES: DUF5958 family protein [Sphingobacterium]APU96359.1 hypothetical protein BV902_08350 [Sphingobacterium sp. B29]UQA76752.1 hypothetical protein K2F45_07090 [Sphingobacterium siyangense]